MIYLLRGFSTRRSLFFEIFSHARLYVRGDDDEFSFFFFFYFFLLFLFFLSFVFLFLSFLACDSFLSQCDIFAILLR